MIRYPMLTATAAALVLPAAPAQAEWPPAIERAVSSYYHECMRAGDAAGGVTSAMLSCNGEEIERQDARLNQAYRMTMMRLPATRKARLRNDERVWIKRRDGGCRREAGTEGTASTLNYSGCILRETIARRLWLEKFR